MRAKFIYEKFIEDSDPIQDMSIGMKTLIKNWLDKMEITYTLNNDLTINGRCVDIVFLDKSKKLPDYIQFNKVTGYFDISNNNLITLKGCPKIVDGDFYCEYNKLTSLKYAPKIVTDSFVCHGNKKHFTKEDVIKVCKTKRKYMSV
jgi:hypothetical protein